MTDAHDLNAKVDCDMVDRETVSRRNFLERSLRGAIIAGATGLAIRDAAAQAKTSQADARYQDHPNGNKQCSTCKHFKPPTDCEVVQGPVAANGFCIRFEPKG